MRTIAIVNQKGGCGKTTTAVSLAAVFARRGKRTLLVDLDPQSHCALGLGVPLDGIRLGVADALVDPMDEDFDPKRYTWGVSRRLDLLPSTVSLAGLDAPDSRFATLPDRDTRLASVLERYAPNYDICLVDCPPTLSILTYSVLRCTREVLVPVETSYFAFRGAKMQWQAIRSVIDRIRRPIAVHMLPTLHRPDSRVARDILSELNREFAELILPIEVRYHDTLREAAAIGMPITEYQPSSEARHDYEQLADWLEEHRMPQAEVSVGAREAQVALGRRGVGAPARPGISGDRVREMIRLMQARRGGEDQVEAADVAATPVPTPEPEITPVAERPGPIPGRDDHAASNGRLDRAASDEGRAPGRDGGRAAEAVERLGRPSRVEAHRAPFRVEADLDDGTDASLLGAHVTSRGVLFVQPPQTDATLSVAGDFNGWSPTRHPLERNDETGMLEVLVAMGPGRHRYRIVTDGRWEPDPFNAERAVNGKGEAHSVIEVPVEAVVTG